MLAVQSQQNLTASNKNIAARLLSDLTYGRGDLAVVGGCVCKALEVYGQDRRQAAEGHVLGGRHPPRALRAVVLVVVQRLLRRDWAVWCDADV
jgi:hypothetical protein